ncbi:MAG: insulinase family protein [Clostridia bacterium]|nr:insulinase family protein [Clostridia bacterium]
MQKIKLKGGVDLYSLKSDKFKRWSANIYLCRPLNEKEASYNAVLSAVLRRATMEYPTFRKLQLKLDNMYGTVYTSYVKKTADTHTLVLSVSSVCDKYLPEKTSVQVLKFLKNALFNPYVINGSFDSATVELEKENRIKQIDALINNKGDYADKRLTEIMFEGQPFATDVLGSIDEIRKITAESLYEHYNNVINDSKIVLAVCGDVDINIAKEEFEEISSNENIPKSTVADIRENVKEVTEPMEVTQGKLSMGFKIERGFPLARAEAIVFNAIFGGTATSKLFTNVRERLSLCYYANSRLFYGKRVITVRSGIEIDKYNLVKEEVLNQLSEIQKGNISNEELENAKAHLVNIYTSLDDQPRTKADLIASWLFEGESGDVEALIENIKKVSVEDIKKIAEYVKLDTVYFLTGKGE